MTITPLPHSAALQALYGGVRLWKTYCGSHREQTVKRHGRSVQAKRRLIYCRI
jgi:hypothetical protein